MTDGQTLYEPHSQDIVEKLIEIATTPRGAPMPKCLRGPDNPDGYELNADWASPLSQICREAAEEIKRLRNDSFPYPGG